VGSPETMRRGPRAHVHPRRRLHLRLDVHAPQALRPYRKGSRGCSRFPTRW
jgi:hypothetical protein